MSYLYRAKVGQKGFFGGKIRVNTGEGTPEVFRSDEKLKESDKAWYERVPEGEAPEDTSSQSSQSTNDNQDVQHDPNAIADAFSELDHGNDDHWNKNGTPKISALNSFYKGQSQLKVDDIKDLHLKRVVQDDK